jgi:hypothetical protein
MRERTLNAQVKLEEGYGVPVVVAPTTAEGVILPNWVISFVSQLSMTRTPTAAKEFLDAVNKGLSTKDVPVNMMSPVEKAAADNAGVLGDYHLLLAHKVVAEPDAWLSFYEHLHETYPEPFVIMDNSLIELGEPLDAMALIEAASIVNASCIVLADSLSQAHETVRLSEAMANELERRNNKFPLMGVCQGWDIPELEFCANIFVTDLGVEYLCVPRVFCNTYGSRGPAIQAVQPYKRPIHLLGFSNDKWDDIASAKMNGVMGIDSAEPVWRGLRNEEFGLNLVPESRPPKYLESTEFRSLSTSNVQFVRERIQGP